MSVKGIPKEENEEIYYHPHHVISSEIIYDVPIRTDHACYYVFSVHWQDVGCALSNPDSKVHEDNMGPNWVLSAPDGPRVGSMYLAIRELLFVSEEIICKCTTKFHPCILLWILGSQAGSWLCSFQVLLVSEEITCNVPIRSTHTHYYGFSLHKQEVGWAFSEHFLFLMRWLVMFQ